jgi:hypothetical protein
MANGKGRAWAEDAVEIRRWLLLAFETKASSSLTLLIGERKKKFVRP